MSAAVERIVVQTATQDKKAIAAAAASRARVPTVKASRVRKAA